MTAKRCIGRVRQLKTIAARVALARWTLVIRHLVNCCRQLLCAVLKHASQKQPNTRVWVAHSAGLRPLSTQQITYRISLTECECLSYATEKVKTTV